MLSTERRMWTLFEPVHAITYFAPDALAAFEEAGLRGFWRGYFAGRSAPLGAVGPGPVIAAFYGFAPRMVTRALPDVWTRITPEVALSARLAGARRVLPDVDADLAAMMRAAAEAVELHGRVLGAANALLPWPSDPAGILWQAATILRESRGDGHLALLLGAGLDGCEANAWRVALGGVAGREFYQQARGWTDEEWDAALDRLRDRGWADAEGAATPAAREAYTTIERDTDRLAAAPWRALGAAATARCAELLHPVAVLMSQQLRHPNPIGLPTLP